MMSDRPRIELNTVQLVASALAAVTGAVLTSYLGVGGTVAGTAVGSVATTSGFAIYKHYLGRTKDRIDHVTPVIVEHARVWTPTAGYHPVSHAGHPANGTGRRPANGSPARAGPGGPDDQQTQPMQAWDPGRAGAELAGQEAGPPAQPAGSPSPGSGQPGSGQPGSGQPTQQLGTVRLEGSATANGDANGNGNGNRTAAGILRGRPRWVGLAATSAAVFVLVIAAITVFELATGKPLAATVRGQQGSGTTLSGGATESSGTGTGTPQPTQSAAPSHSSTSPTTGQTAPQPSSGASTSPAPSSVPSPSAAPSVKATPPAPSAPVGKVPPSG
jgi:hypothetical protein